MGPNIKNFVAHTLFGFVLLGGIRACAAEAFAQNIFGVVTLMSLDFHLATGELVAVAQDMRGAYPGAPFR